MTQTSTKTGLKKISVKIRDAEVLGREARTGVALSTGFNRLGALLQTVFLSYSSSVT